MKEKPGGVQRSAEQKEEREIGQEHSKTVKRTEMIFESFSRSFF